MIIRQLDYKTLISGNKNKGLHESEAINLTNVKFYSIQLNLDNSSDDLELVASLKVSLDGNKFSEIEASKVIINKNKDCLIWEVPDRAVKYVKFCCLINSGSSNLEALYCSFGTEN